MPTDIQIGQAVRINESAPYFSGRLAYVAYKGNDGVSVYLDGDIEGFDDCICLKWGEFDAD